MPFEFDPVKSAANQRKHGIDFVEAQAIWLDEQRLVTAAQSATEPREQVLGRIGPDLWSAFITHRHENIRLISVRKARTEERKRYYDH